MRCERGDEPVCQERDGEGDNATEPGDSEPFLVYHPGIKFGMKKPGRSSHPPHGPRQPDGQSSVVQVMAAIASSSST